MSKVRTWIVVVFYIVWLVCIASCEDSNNDTNWSAGNVDAASTYFSSYSLMVNLDKDGMISQIFDMGDHIGVVARLGSGDESIYRILMINKEKKEVAYSSDVALPGLSLSFCSTEDNKVVCARSNGYSVIDPLSGTVIADEEISGLLSDETPSVARSGDGFPWM